VEVEHVGLAVVEEAIKNLGAVRDIAGIKIAERRTRGGNGRGDQRHSDEEHREIENYVYSTARQRITLMFYETAHRMIGMFSKAVLARERLTVTSRMSRSSSPSPWSRSPSPRPAPTHFSLRAALRTPAVCWVAAIFVVIFAFVITSFFFPDELRQYSGIAIEEKYIQAFQRLSWVLLVVSLLTAIAAFVAQFGRKRL
jgi:hypothetical protein